MHTILVTGANGYLGGYVCTELLDDPELRLAVLVRGADRTEALTKLWSSWQLHLTADQFRAVLPRVHIVLGDLHAPELGLSEAQLAGLRDSVDSMLHIAATLNRMSSKACFNTNLRGTLSVIKLARWLHERRGLERVGVVSTAAIAGDVQSKTLTEEEALDWSVSDFDPYARTKKFCEHMVAELLPDLPCTIYRPSIVMGDSRFPQTNQFDMIFATCMLADLPALPLKPDCRLDIVNADWVGHAIATIHRAPQEGHVTYHLSSGRKSPTVAEIARSLEAHTGRRARFAPQLEFAWTRAYRAAHRLPRGMKARGLGTLWKVFWPYVVFDTVFLNERAVAAVGSEPVPFPTYFPGLYDWVKTHEFRYPTLPLPEGIA